MDSLDPREHHTIHGAEGRMAVALQGGRVYALSGKPLSGDPNVLRRAGYALPEEWDCLLVEGTPRVTLEFEDLLNPEEITVEQVSHHGGLSIKSRHRLRVPPRGAR